MFSKLLSSFRINRSASSILLPAIFGWLFTILSVYLAGDYGSALFVCTPLFMGMAATVIYGYKRTYVFKQAVVMTTYSLLVYCLGLILFALEGAICIVMAAPLGYAIAYVGALIGHAILKRRNGSPLTVLTGLGLLVPALMAFESNRNAAPPLHAVSTSVIIAAPPEKVWDKVVAFSHIEEPEEWLFRAGIAYPTHAEIKGSGAGAIRYCNFSTGRFVEPITTWQQPELLAFSVVETPEPLKEISPYDIKPVHLHGYFVSKKGQFKLTRLGENKTLLEGTTWYYHKIQPTFYWKIWSNCIIHKIHNRVLQHIRKEAEQQ